LARALRERARCELVVYDQDQSSVAYEAEPVGRRDCFFIHLSKPDRLIVTRFDEMPGERSHSPTTDELRFALADVLRKDDVEEAAFLHEGLRLPAPELMELEHAEQLAAVRRKRTPDRTVYRKDPKIHSRQDPLMMLSPGIEYRVIFYDRRPREGHQLQPESAQRL
jgi:hypothetical protein